MLDARAAVACQRKPRSRNRGYKSRAINDSSIDSNSVDMNGK
jgi:hypothetical protein